MKIYHLFFCILFLSIGFKSMCQQQDFAKNIKKIEPIKVTNEIIRVDSLEYVIDITKPYFQSEDGRCENMNKEIENFLDSIQIVIKKESNEFFKSWDDKTEILPPFNLSVVPDTIFFISNKYISVLFYVEIYRTGAPHGSNYSVAFNYDLKNKKLLSNEEIIDYSRKNDIEKLLKKHFNNKEGCFSYLPTLDKNYTLNFSEKEFIFTYRPYLLGSYACWYAQIIMPREEIDKFIIKK
ncbi:MAG: hypothetical protein H6Q16_774 [Bacteroidetes bacterium]|nr:hypothetical protein [Bacteroidota bacterium]